MYKTNVKSYNFLEKTIINCYNIKGGIKLWKKIEIYQEKHHSEADTANQVPSRTAQPVDKPMLNTLQSEGLRIYVILFFHFSTRRNTDFVVVSLVYSLLHIQVA